MRAAHLMRKHRGAQTGLLRLLALVTAVVAGALTVGICYADASAREQAGVDPSAAGVAARLAAGNAAYEERFGHVFLIRAAGRSAEEILAELDRRLGNEARAERAEVADNLRQIALLRLEQAV